MSKKSPLVLCILDGFGCSDTSSNNAVTLAHTPTLDDLFAHYPHTTLQASQQYVGLPEGQMGNSEVGHMQIGAGRVVLQDLPRISLALQDGSAFQSSILENFIYKMKASKGTCHLMGLLSDGGVHSHQDHLMTLIHFLSKHEIPVGLHLFLDGRDTPPTSGLTYLKNLIHTLKSFPNVSIKTLGGRYFAMDRDHRWERIETAYDAIARGKTLTPLTPIEYIEQQYTAGMTDEFIKPASFTGHNGIHDGDGLFMSNYRADRVRQILETFLMPTFTHFNRSEKIKFAATLGMMSYSSMLDPFIPALFATQEITHTLGELISDAGMTQLRIAETEKYAHVTFFLNAGREHPFVGEDRIMIPSPKVATYDLAPEMSAYELTDKLLLALDDPSYDIVMINYANTDMVGHTGIQKAAIIAVETVDNCLNLLKKKVLELGGTLIITADHGNIEEMQDDHGHAHTAHTVNPVPFILVNHDFENKPTTSLRSGSLCDVAPTILALLKLPQPKIMTGWSLLLHKNAN